MYINYQYLHSEFIILVFNFFVLALKMCEFLLCKLLLLVQDDLTIRFHFFKFTLEICRRIQLPVMWKIVKVSLWKSRFIKRIRIFMRSKTISKQLLVKSNEEQFYRLLVSHRLSTVYGATASLQPTDEKCTYHSLEKNIAPRSGNPFDSSASLIIITFAACC